jgi:hypothetical protein
MKSYRLVVPVAALALAGGALLAAVVAPAPSDAATEQPTAPQHTLVEGDGAEQQLPTLAFED